MFFEGVRSERKLIETASLHLAHRWYLGYVLDEGLPDHSNLTRIRQRLGMETFERFFERVVDLWQEAGLVWGRELFFDATEAYRKAMRKRQVWVEPVFAEAKDWHGLRRFRLRKLDNVNSEGLLIAAGQNLKRLWRRPNGGRRHAPCGSLVALPARPGRLAATYT